jgi:hypothetical protein
MTPHPTVGPGWPVRRERSGAPHASPENPPPSGVGSVNHIPYKDDAFSWLASYLARSYWRRPISVRVEGEAQIVTPGPSRPDNTLRLIGPIWCPVANVIARAAIWSRGRREEARNQAFSAGRESLCQYPVWQRR